MRHAVIVQVGACSEPLPAHLTLVWLLPAVDAPVCVQWTGCGEPLTAHQAHVRLLACIQHITSYRKWSSPTARAVLKHLHAANEIDRLEAGMSLGIPSTICRIFKSCLCQLKLREFKLTQNYTRRSKRSPLLKWSPSSELWTIHKMSLNRTFDNLLFIVQKYDIFIQNKLQTRTLTEFTHTPNQLAIHSTRLKRIIFLRTPLTSHLTTGSRVLLENPTIAQLGKKFPTVLLFLMSKMSMWWVRSITRTRN
jgi:hypothetical protein